MLYSQELAPAAPSGWGRLHVTDSTTTNDHACVTTPAPQPQWHQLTPEQQAWWWQQHNQAQALQLQRQQLELQRRNRHTTNTLVGLFVWTPLILLGTVFVLWVLTTAVS